MVCAVAVGLCVALGGVVAAQTMLMEPPTPLLPATLGKLQRVAVGDVGDGLGLVDAADAAAMTEDGLRRFARSEYGNSNGKDFWPFATVTVYKFFDASGAVAAYDYFRRPGMRAEKVGDDAVSNGDELLMRSGANVVVGHFRLDHEAMIALTRELIGGLPKVNGAAGIAPMLPGMAAVKGIDADSVRYALGPVGYKAMGGVLPEDVLGFDKSAEVASARNMSGGLLTLLLYPTPEIASEHERMIAAVLNGTGPGPTEVPGTTAAKMGPTRTVKMRREGTLLLLALGSWPGDEAARTIDGIHLRQEVTWDKPVPLDFATEVHKTFSLLENIAIFCAISALAMLVLGLFLGYGRALIRVMQGKPAATEPEFLRIDLRGAVGKRLRDPED
jgi:hypothetical protein